MIRSFGLSGFPVAQAGQTSWHRPHSVQLNRSSTCLRERSAAVAAPKRRSSSGPSRSSSRGSSRPDGPVFASQTFGAAVRMCRCFDPGR